MYIKFKDGQTRLLRSFFLDMEGVLRMNCEEYNIEWEGFNSEISNGKVCAEFLERTLKENKTNFLHIEDIIRGNNEREN